MKSPRPLRKGLVLRSAKKNGFVAGAEISEFKDMTDEAIVKEKINQGLAVLDKLEAMRLPDHRPDPRLLPRRRA